MIKTLCSLLFILGGYALQAQQPILEVDGPDSNKVRLTKLDLDVKIAGNIATTTMTMRFCNSGKRVLEGELTFPMPEGVSISRFALDMNGHMREAVPVEKEKGQVVFENIERQNVDPGLLEKVEGNSFRTRIYPIPAGGCRTVIVAYEQELHQGSKQALLYSLPMHFNYPIKEFAASFNVFSSALPEVGSDCNTGLKFDTLKNVFQAAVKRQNFKPDGSFQLMMPMLESQAGVMMQEVNGQYYFMVNTYPAAKVQDKKMPSAISIVWDVSLSGRLRNHQKEFDLLDKYFKQLGNVKVNLLTLSLELVPAGQFAVSGGDWSTLKTALDKMIYDGATNFSAFRQNLPGEEVLFFTDGLNTWGRIQETGFATTPVYPINASGSADYELLRLVAAKTGGVFINLNETTPDEGLTSLTRLPLQLINVKTGGMVSEVYPSIATPVQGNCAVTGISSTPQTEITLEFGYGQTVTYTQTVKLDLATTQVQQIPLDKIWAQKKIAQLNMQYDVFKNLITSLGKKYGVVTRNTSLIVLDDIADYVKYEIDPPAELKAEYARLMNQKKAGEEKIKSKSINDAVAVYSEVSRWWDKDFKPVKRVIRYVDVHVDSTISLNTITGRVVNEKGEPLPGASVIIKNKRAGVAVAVDGSFSINRTGDVVLQFSYVGYHVMEIPVPANRNTLNVTLEPSGQILEEVVVVVNGLGYRDGDARVMADSARMPARNAADALRNVPSVQAEARPVTPAHAQAQTSAAREEAVVVSTAYGVQRTAGTLNYSVAVPDRTLARRTTGKKGKKKKAVAARNTYLLGYADADGLASGADAPVNTVAGGINDRTYQWSNGNDMQVVTTAVPFLRVADSTRSGSYRDTTAFFASGRAADGDGEMTVMDFSPERIYLAAMDSAAISGNAYTQYLELRKDYDNIPAFYFDMANFFIKKGDRATGIKILSGIADLGIEDHELFKTLGYQLKALGMYDEEINVFKKVLDWRPQEPQSYRDYALALSDGGKYQQALDTLYTALLKNYNTEIAALYPGIEEIILTEINNIVALKEGQVNKSKIEKSAIKNMAVDVRVVLNWNMNDTDIDLWVIDPNEEKCYYSHRETVAGGRISRDFTRGYGPEQFMVKKALKGKYKVMLHYYGDRQQKIAGPTTVMAEIFLNYGKPNQERKMVVLHMEKKGDTNGTSVAEFDFE